MRSIWKKFSLQTGLAVGGFAVSVLGLYFGVAATLELPPFPDKGEPKLELVDAKIWDDGEYPYLDLKVKNSGGGVAYLYRAQVTVWRVWTLTPVDYRYFANVPPGYGYELPLKDQPGRYETDLSEAVDPNSIDRFYLTLKNVPPVEGSVLKITAQLLYDTDDKSLVIDRTFFYVCDRSGAVVFGSREDRDVAQEIQGEIQAEQGIMTAGLERALSEILK